MADRKVLRELMTESAVVDSLNAQKREQRKQAPKGFGITNSVHIKDSVEIHEPVTEVKDETPSEPAQPIVSVTLEQVQNLINNQLTPVKQQLTDEQKARQELQAQLDQSNREKQEIAAKLAIAERDQAVLADLSKLAGSPVQAPNVNRIIGSKSDKPEGALKDFLDIQSKAPKLSKYTAKGRPFLSADNRELNEFAKQNREQLKKDLESWGKQNGFFRGSNKVSTDAATTGADILGGFLSVLSAIMRTNNRDGKVFWQFADTVLNFEKGLGDNIKIPRAAYLPGPTEPDDRLLSSASTYVRIDSGNQNLSTGTVTAELKEWGLGRNSSHPPVTITSFVNSYSMIDLLQILNRNLLRDYHSWEDLKIRRLWSPTSRVVYNDGNVVTTDKTTIGTGDGATMVRKFLTALYGYMKELDIPAYAGDKYGIAMNNTALVQLKQDLDRLWSPSTPQQLQALSEYLNPTLIAPGETDRISGFVGEFENFLIFNTNAIGAGAAGSEGVRAETINSTSHVTRSSYAFGANSIGRGIGTEMEIRMDDDTDFQRADRCIWRSEEAFVAMDVDPTGYNDTSDVPQQLRVIEVRTTTNAI